MATPLHIRTQLRHAAVAALENLPTTGPHVFTGRPYPLSPKERPGLVVVIPTESSAGDTMGDAPTLARTPTIHVIGYHDGEDIEDLLDAIAVEVEVAMATGLSIAGRAFEVILKATQMSVDGDVGTKRPGQIVMAFDVDTRTLQSDPTAFV